MGTGRTTPLDPGDDHATTTTTTTTRLKTGPVFKLLSRSRSKLPRVRSAPTPTYFSVLFFYVFAPRCTLAIAELTRLAACGGFDSITLL